MCDPCTALDYLAPTFCGIRMFMPELAMPRLFPELQMVLRVVQGSIFFNPEGQRVAEQNGAVQTFYSRLPAHCQNSIVRIWSQRTYSLMGCHFVLWQPYSLYVRASFTSIP
jgi:hypothetical protein